MRERDAQAALLRERPPVPLGPECFGGEDFPHPIMASNPLDFDLSSRNNVPPTSEVMRAFEESLASAEVNLREVANSFRSEGIREALTRFVPEVSDDHAAIFCRVLEAMINLGLPRMVVDLLPKLIKLL
jgi:hypothetical protein